MDEQRDMSEKAKSFKQGIRAIEERPISRFHFDNFIKPHFQGNPYIDDMNNIEEENPPINPPIDEKPKLEKDNPPIDPPTEKDNPEQYSTPQWILDVEREWKAELGDRVRINTRPKDLVEVVFFATPEAVERYRNPFKKREKEKS